MLDSVIYEHIEPTDAIKEHVEKAVDSLKGALPEYARLALILDHPGQDRFSALIKISLKGQELVAREEDDDLYQAITASKRIMLQQIRKHRSKKISLKHKEGVKSKSRTASGA